MKDYLQFKIRVTPFDHETIDHIRSLTGRGIFSQVVIKLLYDSRHKYDAKKPQQLSFLDTNAYTLTSTSNNINCVNCVHNLHNNGRQNSPNTAGDEL